MVAHCRRLAGAPEAAEPAPVGSGRPGTTRAGVASLPVLSVVSLGRTQINRGAEVLPGCPGRKANALFRYLLIRPDRAAHKEELMELFWPDSPPREGEHSLHVAVGALRRHLDPAGARPGCRGYVLFEAGSYRLNPAATIREDRDLFDRLTAEAGRAWHERDVVRACRSYTEALALYRGDYQADATQPVWVLVERERLLAHYLRALDHLARIAMAHGQYEQAVEHYLRLLERDPYREDAHAQAMRCYERLGRRYDALRQYERCAALLAADLGLEPAPDLRALHRAILGADPMPPHDTVPVWDALAQAHDHGPYPAA
jgi:DNA-binding SARP family transcriptional activator